MEISIALAVRVRHFDTPGVEKRRYYVDENVSYVYNRWGTCSGTFLQLPNM